MQLVCADALLAARHESKSEKPLVQRNFRIFEDRADCDSEGLAAGIAHDNTGARALAGQAGYALGFAALRADRAIRPVQCLKVFAGRVCIAVDGVGKIKHFSPFLRNEGTLAMGGRYVKYIIAEVRAKSDPSLLPTVDYVSQNLLPYLKNEAARDPKTRKIIKAIPWVLGGAAIIAYYVVRFSSAIPIEHALATKAGIQERAAAVEKLLRYDELMETHVRRGGWVKGILFWPVEPTDAEIKGASEFAALAFQAHTVSVEQFGCPEISRGSDSIPSKSELDFLDKTAEYLRAPATYWKDPPIDTAVEAAKVFGHC